MKISFVVPAFNEEKVIVGCLQSIKEAARSFTAKSWTYELIVCNNNSTDRTAELALSEGAHVVFEPVNQIGRARNKGASAATGDWLIFVDADSHANPGLFGDVAEIIERGQHIAGGATVDLDEFYLVPHVVVMFWNILSRVAHCAAGSFIFCERRAFEIIGGFNNNLYASEELDLSRRLNRLARREGKKRLTILHHHPLVTSTRKFHLYSYREHGKFLLRTISRLGRTLNDRKECFPWYDGRR